MTQTYEAWRITYQSSEQAARAAFERMMELEQGKCLLQIAEPSANLLAECKKLPRVEALKTYRAKTGCTLLEARDALFPDEAAPQAEIATGPCGQCKDDRTPCMCAISTMLGERRLVAVDATHYANVSARAKAAAPQEVQPAVPQIKANCYSNDDGDYWRDCPDDCDFVDGLKVGDTYELQASIRSWSETFRVTKAPDETSDDYEVELVSSDAPAHPAEGVPDPALSRACDLLSMTIGTLMGFRKKVGYTDNSPIAGLVNDAVEFLQPWPEKLPTATQPAAQGLDAQKLHNDIMNIPATCIALNESESAHNEVVAYKQGHKDARHAAAELALAAQAKQGGA